jgi:hypothetical protein
MLSVWKKTKIIMRFLAIFVIIFGWVFAANFRIDLPLYKISKVSAAVPSGVIVAWPSTVASIPAGWSRVTTLDSYYLEGTTSDPSGTAGGSATHSHTSPSHAHEISHAHTGTTGQSAGTTQTGTAATGVSRNQHTHSITTGIPNLTDNNASSTNFGTASNDPPYTEVIWIESDGTTDIPDNAWALFDSDPLSLPTDWSRQNGNKFLKGATTDGDGGGTGGSSEAHTHTDPGHTHTEGAHTHTGTTGTAANAYKSQSRVTGLSQTSHTHTISGGSQTATEGSGVAQIANADGQPPFYKLDIIQNDTGSGNTPSNIIAMWDGTILDIPTGWVLCDGNGSCPNLNDKFIKGANADSESGTTGGATTHTHSAGTAHTHAINSHTHTFTVAADTGNQQGASGTGYAAANYNHTHTLSVTGGGTTGSATVTADANTSTGNRPPYKEIVFIQYQGAAISISLSTNGSVALGFVALEASQDTTPTGINDVETVSVDNGPASLDIKSTTFSEGVNTWTLGASNGSKQVQWQYSSSTSPWYTMALVDTNYDLDNSVAQGATRNIYLKITMPTATDSYSQYSATLTITASTP